MIYVRIASYAFVAILSALMAWKWQEVRYLQRESEIQTQAYNQIKAAKEAAEVERMIIESARAELLREVSEKNAEIDRLASDVDAARVGLRIAVLQQSPFKPDAKDDTCRSEACTAELAASARQAYFDLRRAIVDSEAWINLCHRTVNAAL